MSEEQKNALETSEQNAPAQDNPSAAPAENKEALKVTEDIDPRIVDIVGADEVQSAFGEKPEENGTPADEEKEEIKTEELKKDDQEKQVEEKEVDIPAITPLDPKPTRLDRRIAQVYTQNCLLAGQKQEDIPTEEQLIADLQRYSKEDKINSLNAHLAERKKLKGQRPSENNFEEEDIDAIKDAEREAIRHEILTEQHEVQYKTSFVDFVGSHPELVAGEKEYNPVLSQAVETLWRGGMPIETAYQTVTDEIRKVKEAQESEARRAKNAALSGVMSGSGQVPTQGKELDWEAVEKLQEEDPQLYNRMLKEGKFKHLM